MIFILCILEFNRIHALKRYFTINKSKLLFRNFMKWVLTIKTLHRREAPAHIWTCLPLRFQN